ncbi:MAG TPA: hypothetical protein VFM22_03365, partial [Castellaniella sp.]|nr:hypothetical protein [Castellaniella sp.]
ATLSRLAHRFDLEFLGKSLLHGIRTHDNSSSPHYEAGGCLEVPGRFNLYWQQMPQPGAQGLDEFILFSRRIARQREVPF